MLPPLALEDGITLTSLDYYYSTYLPTITPLLTTSPFYTLALLPSIYVIYGITLA